MSNIDSTLLGKYDQDATKVKRAVYRVKDKDVDTYTRVHFETSSQMVHDATSKKTANMIARRDDKGSIQFQDMEAAALTKTNTLQVASTSALKGVTTIGADVAENATALTVSAKKNTSLGGTLSVAGTSAFTGKTTHSGGVDVSNGLKVGGGADITGGLTSNSNASMLADLSVTGSTTLGKADHSKTTTINGVAKINKLEVTNSEFVANLNADRVDNCHVDDTKSDTETLWTASKVNTTKADKSISITGSNGLAGGGNLAENREISHSTKTVSKTTDDSKGFVGIKSMTFDSYGHPSSYVEVDFDKRYPTKSQVAQDIANSNLTVTRELLAKNPQNRVDNGNQVVMESFTMRFNKTANAIEFVFV